MPAAVRFVSCEPLLEPLDLRPWLKPLPGGLDWVIVGDESGDHRRVVPDFDDAVRALRDQCSTAGAAFFLKQRHDRQGRKVSMPELDGRVWDQVPNLATGAGAGRFSRSPR